MKKIIILIISIFVLWFLWWTISPLFITKTVNEALPITPTTNEQSTNTNNDAQLNKTSSQNDLEKIKSGVFTGFDVLHNGSGAVNLYKQGDSYFVRFESDFTVTNGPDLYVSLGKNGEYTDAGILQKLKGNVGSQNYSIPNTMNIGEYDSVYIWCKAFSVPFAKAILQ